MLPLSADATGFTPRNAYACALASHAAYLAPELSGGIAVDEWGMSNFRRSDRRNAQGFVAANGAVTLVAFRGSERYFDDWSENVDTQLVPGPFAERERTHRGFSAGLAAVLEEIESRIDSLGARDAPLFLTGHSLGAALATLAAAHFYTSGRDVHSVYAFGSPRVGCRRFREVYKRHDRGRTFRIVNRHDIVARIPPRLLRYRHVGLLRYLDAEGAIHDDLNFWQRMLLYLDPAGRDPKAYINDLVGRLPGALDDHKVRNYIEKLSRHADLNRSES